MRTATDRFGSNFKDQNVCANHKFCPSVFKVLRPCVYGLGYPTQLHKTWPPRMRIVAFFALRNTVKNKYTANSNFPTPLELVLFKQHPPYTCLKIVHAWLTSRTEKKKVPSCSCLRSPYRTRIRRCRASF